MIKKGREMKNFKLKTSVVVTCLTLSTLAEARVDLTWIPLIGNGLMTLIYGNPNNPPVNQAPRPVNSGQTQGQVLYFPDTQTIPPVASQPPVSIPNKIFEPTPSYQPAVPTPPRSTTREQPVQQSSSSSGEKLKWPVPINTPAGRNTIVSPYGARDRGDGHDHRGIDINVPKGTPVSSSFDGKITYISPACYKTGGRHETAAGCQVAVTAPDGRQTSYAHLDGVNNGLRVGQSVRSGETIGKSGNTGDTDGPHLHFATCRVNPAKAMDKAPVKACSAEYGGKSTNPMDQLDQNDPRYKEGKEFERRRDGYLNCKKTVLKKSAVNLLGVRDCRKKYDSFQTDLRNAPTKYSKPMSAGVLSNQVDDFKVKK